MNHATDTIAVAQLLSALKQRETLEDQRDLLLQACIENDGFYPVFPREPQNALYVIHVHGLEASGTDEAGMISNWMRQARVEAQEAPLCA